MWVDLETQAYLEWIKVEKSSSDTKWEKIGQGEWPSLGIRKEWILFIEQYMEQ